MKHSIVPTQRKRVKYNLEWEPLDFLLQNRLHTVDPAQHATSPATSATPMVCSAAPISTHKDQRCHVTRVASACKLDLGRGFPAVLCRGYSKKSQIITNSSLLIYISPGQSDQFYFWFLDFSSKAPPFVLLGTLLTNAKKLQRLGDHSAQSY